MKDINQLLKEIIPPADYQHRNGFSNEHIILSLAEEEKIEVENNLIEMLEKSEDYLIGETLSIMKSKKSLPTLKKRLDSTKNSSSRIIWASFINEIKGGDEEMKNVALSEMDNVKDKYSLIFIFHYLSQFQDSRIKEKVLMYVNHKDYLIAYNARTSLGIETEDLIERESAKKQIKKW